MSNYKTCKEKRLQRPSEFVNSVLFSFSKIMQYCKNISSLWRATSSMFRKLTVWQLPYYSTSWWKSKNENEKNIWDVFIFFSFFFKFLFETQFKHDSLKTKTVCMCWSCVVAQAVSIFCTVSCTMSSFKGTTFSVRTGVVPGWYLYFIFLE